LLTKDRVLHNLAIGRGFRSFVHTPESSLTDRCLAHVSATDNYLPASSGTIRDSYVHQSDPDAQSIIGCLVGFLSEHQLKQFRTKRRRIRAYFGSADNIAAIALTIGQRRIARGVVGGYMLKVDARHGAKSLSPASEPAAIGSRWSAARSGRSSTRAIRNTRWAVNVIHTLDLALRPFAGSDIDFAISRAQPMNRSANGPTCPQLLVLLRHCSQFLDLGRFGEPSCC
jgi:hypothetical protein